MDAKKIAEFRYEVQQRALDKIAANLGVTAYRPDYHGKGDDKNTVFFFLPEEEALISGYVSPNYFWVFENTDCNGVKNLEYAKHGEIDLQETGWKTKLEGHIRLAQNKRLQIKYLARTGGVLALREADEYYNDLNREQIKAFRMMHGTAFLGDINIHDHEKYKRVRDGSDEGLYTEYTGQLVYNFGCDFCVPTEDEELAELIRQWNRSERLPKKMADIDAITKKIEDIGGIQFIWY